MVVNINCPVCGMSIGLSKILLKEIASGGTEVWAYCEHCGELWRGCAAMTFRLLELDKVEDVRIRERILKRMPAAHVEEPS